MPPSPSAPPTPPPAPHSPPKPPLTPSPPANPNPPTLPTSLQSTITEKLQSIVVDRAAHYDCKIAIGVQTDTTELAASSDGDAAAASDLFIWGSVTKMLTGAGVLRAAERGELDLDAPVYPIIDPA